MPFNDFAAGTWWDAQHNVPKLLSGMGEPGTTYEVKVAGTTTLDGIANWHVGDLIYFTWASRKWIRLYDSTGGAAGGPLAVYDEGVLIDSDVTAMDFVGTAVTVTETAPGSVQVSITGGGSALTIEDEGTPVDTATETLNFTGTAVTATQTSPGVVQVAITGGSGATTYDLGFFYVPIAAAGEVLGEFEAVRAFTIPADGGSSRAKAGVAATADYDLRLQKNGSNFGTVRFSAGVVGAGAFTIASDAVFAAGDVLRLVGAASADATLGEVTVTFVGNL